MTATIQWFLLMTTSKQHIPAVPGLWQKGNGTGHINRYKGIKESTIVANFVDKVKKAYPNAFLFKVHGGVYQRSGIPDIMLVLEGIPIFIEFKIPGSDTTALQVAVMEKLDNAGAYYGVATSVEEGLTIIIDALSDIGHA